MMKRVLQMDLGDRSYDIIIERGALAQAGAYLELSRKVMIVTDDGVPERYADTVAQRCAEPYRYVLTPSGEHSKTLSCFQELLSAMLRYGFTRGDCVVAVGGGVVGDLAGYAAASFMRGIDFYNIPTTVLSQVDSSIGGKTGVNLDGIKNIVGAFYQPRRVLIDLDVLATLPARQVRNGLAEALKMSLTSDAELFELFEKGNIYDRIDKIITRSLLIKKAVVERDERESGLRRVLNFGHTIGHGIESFENENGLYHGECVALGMLPMVSDALRPRLLQVLERIGLPTAVEMDPERVYAALLHDKKASLDGVTVVKVDEPGSFRFEELPFGALRPLLNTIPKE